MDALEQVAALLHRESGLVLHGRQLDALAHTLDRLDPLSDAAGFLRLAAHPVTGLDHLARLVDEVTVKETYFLRHVEQLEEIDWYALLALAHAAGSATVSVWSAGCATGEEAYSLALLACEAFGTLAPPVTIHATDISATALARARQGDYGARSTRELDPRRRQRYFQQDEARLRVNEHLRALVSFARHNLVTDPTPPRGEAPFHLILCRNVLIYFDVETVDRVIAGLERALAPSGTLLLGAADALCRGASRLRALSTQVAPRDASPEPPKRLLRRPLGRAAEPVSASESTLMPDPSESPDLSPAAESAADAPGATAHFLNGLARLEAGDPHAAVASLRRALYASPRFGLAAFQLGRSYEALGELSAARRAYKQALRSFTPDQEQVHESLLEQITLDDVRMAAENRLEALEPPPTSPSGRRRA